MHIWPWHADERVLLTFSPVAGSQPSSPSRVG